MRHRVAGVKLGRTPAHRRALLRNLVTALLEHEVVRTTDAKAKELRRWGDRVITLGKQGTLHARRRAGAGGGAARGHRERAGRGAPGHSTGPRRGVRRPSARALEPRAAGAARRLWGQRSSAGRGAPEQRTGPRMSVRGRPSARALE